MHQLSISTYSKCYQAKQHLAYNYLTYAIFTTQRKGVIQLRVSYTIILIHINLSFKPK